MNRSRMHPGRRLQWIAMLSAVLLTALLLSVVGASAAPRSQSGRQMVYALTTSNRLLSFFADQPARIVGAVKVSGLQPGEQVLGIDFRPSNGKLYALGSTNRLYIVDAQTGKATAISQQPFTPQLEGTAFGVDFNPVPDLLRVVSNTGQNLRINPNTGAVVSNDKRLAYAAADANASKQPAAVGAAYLNPDNNPATGTTLYVIDAAQSALVIQNPPNDGALNTVGSLTADVILPGGSTVTVWPNDMTGFDIAPSNIAYAAFNLRGRINALTTIDLKTGEVNPVGIISSGEAIRGLAIPAP